MIRLKKQADRKVRRGGLWIFSNEIEDPPVKDLIPGAIYDLMDFSGQFLGVVYVNPKSLITARVLSRRKIEIDSNFIRMRLENAFQSRQAFCRDREAHRIFFGEADLLPGLVVDRYGPHIVVQSSTAGVDLLLDKIVDAIDDLFSPQSIVFRNDSSIRNLEGVPIYKEIKRGSNVDRIEFRSEKLSFVADLINGQKTGFFLDQEFNRTILKRHISSNASVLDLYCYSGAWGMNAIEAGADTVTAVDSSSAALELAFDNASLNHCESKINFVREDVGQFLGHCSDQWDVIVLDPPAFIKSRSKVREGRQGYIDVNRKALGRLKPGGLFVTCSCSGHMGLPDFLEAINIAAYRNGRDLRILEVLGQGPDHPTLMTMPETRYLKVIIAQAI
ncbi:MAG: class I SAM-dependent rRNA methyltransferase [Deltaproteobacteria bacterium]|nr:class I SAM-dependent rRNA methyltransferase [Deltaproteobacteria bacterium]